MRKRILIGLLSLTCAFAALGLAGCRSDTTAYELAVKNGFVGTEEEWLRSLHGDDGKDGEDLDAQALYEAAKVNGFTGTFLDFCKELNISIPQYNDTETIAENMLSCVSVYCGYSVTQTVTTGGYLGIGGSTTTQVQYGYSAGSGVIVELNENAGSAYILTNYHVVYNIESDQKGILEDIYIYPYGAYTYFDPNPNGEKGDGIKATFVGGAMDYDIAILKVEGSLNAENVREAKIGASEKVTVGEETYVIGNPAMKGISVTNGILSVDSEYITISALDNRDLDLDGKVDGVSYRVMRTSAAINSGNSGGGIFNTAGELIGIVNAKSSSTTVDNMGYALPISEVAAVCENIRDFGDGKVHQAMLGILVSTTTSSAEIVEGKTQIKEEFCVRQEAKLGGASHGKLHEGDIFLSATLKGKTTVFTRRYQLTDVLLGVRKGDTVVFKVRNSSGREEDISITFDRDSYFTIYG